MTLYYWMLVALLLEMMILSLLIYYVMTATSALVSHLGQSHCTSSCFVLSCYLCMCVCMSLCGTQLQTVLIRFNHLKCSGILWLHFTVFSAIQV